MMTTIDLVMLTAPDGKYLSVHPSQVVALRGSAGHGTLHQGVHCVVFTADGKFLSVVETCPEVDRKLRRHGVTVTNPRMGPVQEVPP